MTHAEFAGSSLPRLAPGRHRTPGSEACVMELTSLLAHEPWSDHPVCVHPVLASVARAVNDRVTESGRARLSSLTTRMIGTCAGDVRISARLVEMCTSAALQHPGWLRPDLETAHRTARYILWHAGGAAGRRPPPPPVRITLAV